MYTRTLAHMHTRTHSVIDALIGRMETTVRGLQGHAVVAPLYLALWWCTGTQGPATGHSVLASDHPPGAGKGVLEVPVRILIWLQMDLGSKTGSAAYSL